MTPDVLDCRGQRCPLPVIALARRLPELPVGAVLRVLADDPAAANDIPAWCRLRGAIRAFRTDRIASFTVTAEVPPLRRLRPEDLDIPYGDAEPLTLAG